jgi:hypothetical protein
VRSICNPRRPRILSGLEVALLLGITDQTRSLAVATSLVELDLNTASRVASPLEPNLTALVKRPRRDLESPCALVEAGSELFLPPSTLINAFASSLTC